MSVLNIPEQTTENLYRQERELAHQDDTAKARLLRRWPDPVPQQEPAPELPGLAQGFQNVMKDLSTQTAGDLVWGGLKSMFSDTFQGLRAVMSPGEAASNVAMSGGDFQEIGTTMKEIFRPDTGAQSDAAMNFAAKFSDDPVNQIAIGTAASVATDPLTYIPVVGAVSAARKANAAKRMVTATAKGERLTDMAHAVYPGNDEVLRLAKQAEQGSKRALRKFSEVVDSEQAAPLLKLFEDSTLRRDYNRIFSVGGQGMKMPKAERRAQAVLNYHRREGNPELLMEELTKGPKYAPFKHSESYLKMNSADDAQSFANVYIQDTRRYVLKALENADPANNLRMREILALQPTILKRQIGDNIPTNIDPVDAFAYRRLLADLASNAQRQVHKTEMKFRSNIDYLRFWKLVSAREAVRANLSGTITNEAPAIMSMLSTEAGDMATQIFKVDRAILKLPEIDPRLERKIAKSISKMDAEQAEMYFNGLFPIAGLEKRMHKLWLNSLLSSPITHSRNIVSNLSVAMLRPIHEMGAAPIAALRGDTSEAVIHLRRAREMALGMGDVFLDSMRIMAGQPAPTAKNMQMFRNMHEASVMRPRLSKEALQNAGMATRALDTLASFMPTEMLGKTDTWFKSLAYRADIRASAVDAASRMTTDPQTRRQLTRQLINDPLELSKGEGFKQAEMATFQNPLPEKVADMLNTMRKFPPMKWVVPFMVTPINIATMGIRYTPFAPILKSVRNDISAGGARRDIALARVATTQAMGLSGVLMLDDRVTGADNSRLRVNQMPEYSIRVGNEWLSYKYIEPLRWILGPMADMREVIMSTDWSARDGEENFQKLASAYVGANYDAVMDNYFMFQVSHVLESLKRGLEDGAWSGLGQVLSGIAQGFVPAGAAWTNRTFIDKNVRELDTFSSRIMNRVPGLSMTLPPKVGLLGEQQTHARQLLGLMPVDIQQASQHPLYAHIQVTNARIPDVPKTLRGAELSATQRASLRIYRANPFGAVSLADASEQLLDSPTYRLAGQEGKAGLITNLIGKYNDLAAAQLWETDAEFRNNAVKADALQQRLMGQ